MEIKQILEMFDGTKKEHDEAVAKVYKLLQKPPVWGPTYSIGSDLPQNAQA